MGNKAIFLDRDNTLIADPGYISKPEQVKLLPGVGKALIDLRNMGYKLVVVTNQSGVARGMVTIKGLEKVHEKMCDLITQEGAEIDSVYYCPYHPDGTIAKYSTESNMRKPSPGMLLAAAKEMDIELEESWMIGNSYRDIEAGQSAGCRTILINSSTNLVYKELTDPVPDNKAVNITEATNIIKMYGRQSKKQAEPKSEAPKPEDNPAVEPEQPEPTPMADTTMLKPDPDTKPEETEQLQPEEEKPIALQPPAAAKTAQAETIYTEHTEKTHRLLEEMVLHLKSVRRAEMFDEFSMLKMIAGVIQFFVLVCILLSVWFLIDPAKGTETVQTTIGYAIVLQLMAIAFYITHSQK